MLGKLVVTYKIWQEYLRHLPKTARYTLGKKIDSLFVEIIEYVVIANYSARPEKLPHLKKGLVKLDVLKFFLQVAWEIKALDNKKFIELSEKFVEIGRMLGGWSRKIEKETPGAPGERK